MAQSLNVIIVEKTGLLKMLAIKEFKEEDLFKKCGFKKSEDFNKQVEWNVKCDSKKYPDQAVYSHILTLGWNNIKMETKSSNSF